MSDPAEAAALARVPDLPQWVDTRGMLLTERATVSFPQPPQFTVDGFVVELAARALISVVAGPPAGLIAERAHALRGEVNVLCAVDSVAVVCAALPRWVQRRVRLQALPGIMAWEEAADRDTSVFTLGDAPPLAHVHEALRAELVDALEGHPTARFVPGALPPRQPVDASPSPIPIAAAWIGGRPVAFCYPVLQSETLWDVSVDTLPEFRGRGMAGRAARAMIRHMRGSGKAPVWGAVETNTASLSVARQLGFEPAGELAVFTVR